MKRFGTTLRTAGHRWFRIWIGAGVALAILLLVNSLWNYLVVSPRVLVDHLRRDLATQVARVEQQMRGSGSNNLPQILEQAQERSSGRIAWVHVINANGEVIAHAGTELAPVFSMDYFRTQLRNRQPSFRTVTTDAGALIVEAFPLRIPSARRSAGGPPDLGVLEAAVHMQGANSILWPLQRNLIINMSASLALLVSILVIAVRFPAYLEGRQLERQLEIARDVQRDLLPSAGRVLKGFDLAADFVPATQVGGDFYDAFSTPRDGAAFVLGDVSGKGVPAALLMGVMHGAVRSSSWTESARHHEEATRQINQLLFERASRERYSTMFWSYFDPQSQMLRYINAGHFPPLLFRAAEPGNPIRLNTGGPVLGMLPNAKFQQGSVRMQPGDVLVLYSDGIIESGFGTDEQFGEERLVALLRECKDKTADEMRDLVLASLQAFTGRTPLEDDRTLLVIRYTGTEPGARVDEWQDAHAMVA